MFTDKVFRVALFVSLFAHGVIFLPQPNFSALQPQKIKNIEVKYFRSPQQREKKALIEKTTPRLEPFLKLPPVASPDKTVLPPAVNKDELFKPVNNKETPFAHAVFTKPALARPEIIAVKKKITLSSSELDTAVSPAYVSYRQLVREKVKQALYQNYNSTETGQVYLTFVLTNDGSLRDIHITQEKSSSSEYLKEISLESVRAAAPFSSFPKGLDYDLLTFNVVISFEIE